MMNSGNLLFQVTTVGATPVDRLVGSLAVDGEKIWLIVNGAGVDVASPVTNSYIVGGGAPIIPGGVVLAHRASGVVSILHSSLPVTAIGLGIALTAEISGNDVSLRIVGPTSVTYDNRFQVARFIFA